MKLRHLARWATAAALGAATLTAISVQPASAERPDHVVINEVYPNGGSAGGDYKNRFYELYNPTSAPVNVSGWSLQYRAPTNVTSAFGSVSPLGDKTIAPGGYLLVSGPGNSGNPKDIPAADVTSSLSAGAAGGQIALSKTTAALPGTGALTNANLVDLVGYGTATYYEGAGAAPAGSPTNGITRSADDHADSNDNAVDFKALAATPCNSAGVCGGGGGGTDPGPATDKTIAEIQGPGASTPIAGQNVTTTGVVTALYATGGFNGAYLQTEGTSGPTGTTSNGVFVSSSALATGAGVAIGKKVSVTGVVSESFGLTQVAASSFTVLGDPATPITPEAVTFPLTTEQKEVREGMLIRPTGTFTITNNYATNQYGEIGLAPGDAPLPTPTDVVDPGAPAAAKLAENQAKLLTLDDGSSTDFFAAANQGTALPYLTDDEVRVGQRLTFSAPVVLDYRFSLWRAQPTSQVRAGATGPVEFGPSTRAAAPASVGSGNITIGAFNVLNYFPTTGEDWIAQGGTCSFYTDRASARVTVNTCSGTGPRGAANAANLKRQQDKIVSAINTLDADVVSLEEIENSVKYGKDRDDAVAKLVAALNAAAGTDKWAYATSPTSLPSLAEQDVIRTALIYQKDAVETVGAGKVLVGSAAFTNARQPYAQAFKPKGAPASSAFVVIVNHFKSKGSGTGQDADQGDGQGASNYSRVQQAHALVDFAEQMGEDADTHRVFLTGDFNAYDREDPIKVIEDAGFVNVGSELTTKETYQFDGMVGSLDHVFAADAVFDDVTGADIWNINSYESIAREYSRFNYNLTNFYNTSPYRASDHDPEIIGVDIPVEKAESTISAKAPGQTRFGSPIPVSVSVGGGGGGEVQVLDGETVLGTGTLTDGTVTIEVSGLSQGQHELTVSYLGDADHAGASTTVNVSVIKAAADLAAADVTSSYGTGAALKVTGNPAANGLLFVFDADGRGIGTGQLTDGEATVTLDKTLSVGTHEVTVSYVGNGNVDPANAEATVTVGKATPTVTKLSGPSTFVANKTKGTIVVGVSAPGFTPNGGTVDVLTGNRVIGSAKVSQGKASVALPVFGITGKRTLTLRYSGGGVTNPGTGTTTITVVKK